MEWRPSAQSPYQKKKVLLILAKNSLKVDIKFFS